MLCAFSFPDQDFIVNQRLKMRITFQKLERTYIYIYIYKTKHEIFYTAEKIEYKAVHNFILQNMSI